MHRLPLRHGEIDPIGFIEGAQRLGAEDRKAIFGGNAARLLSIELPGERSC